MISSIRGEVLKVALDHAVVEVSGFGLHVNATAQTLGQLRTGQSVRLQTSYVPRQDEAPLLFGFADESEREIFSTLLIPILEVFAANAAGRSITMSDLRESASGVKSGDDVKVVGQSIAKTFEIFYEPTKANPDWLGWVQQELDENDRRVKYAVGALVAVAADNRIA